MILYGLSFREIRENKKNKIKVILFPNSLRTQYYHTRLRLAADGILL